MYFTVVLELFGDTLSDSDEGGNDMDLDESRMSIDEDGDESRLSRMSDSMSFAPV